MKISELLEDIIVAPSTFSKLDADRRVQMLAQEKRKWKKVPYVKAEFPLKEFEVVWDKNHGVLKTWEIAVRHISSGDIAFSLKVEDERVATNAGIVSGVGTELAAINKKYSGQGIGVILYQFLIDNGQVLFSSAIQSEGGKKLWRKMVNANQDNTFLVVRADSMLLKKPQFSQLRIPKTKNKSKNWASNVVISGSYKDLIKLAYLKDDSNTSKFLIIPKTSVILDKLKKIAITKDT